MPDFVSGQWLTHVAFVLLMVKYKQGRLSVFLPADGFKDKHTLDADVHLAVVHLAIVTV